MAFPFPMGEIISTTLVTSFYNVQLKIEELRNEQIQIGSFVIEQLFLILNGEKIF